MTNEEFAKTEAGKVWEVFRENGHIGYGRWLAREMNPDIDFDQARARNKDIEAE